MTSPRDIAGIVFDIDGCLARSEKALPGVPETLRQLRDRGIRLTFFTNDNLRTADQWVARLAGMGIPAARDEVLNSAIVTAEVAGDRYAGRRILAIGSEGLKATLRETGAHTILVLTGATDQSQLAAIPAEFRPDAVLPDVTHVINWLDE